MYSLFYLVNKVSGRLKPKTMTSIKRVVGVTSNRRRPSMTEVKSALLVPLFFSFSFSSVQALSFIARTICFALLTTTLGFL